MTDTCEEEYKGGKEGGKEGWQYASFPPPSSLSYSRCLDENAEGKVPKRDKKCDLEKEVGREGGGT